MGGSRILAAAILVTAMAYGIGSASAVTEDELNLCAGTAENPAIRIANCSIEIRMGGMTPDARAAAHYNRGQAYFSLGRAKEALADFEAALELVPDNQDILVNRAATNRKLKNYAAAIADYDRLLEVGFEPAFSIYFNRGIAHHYMGNQDSALSDMRKANALNPDDDNIAETLEKTERLYRYQ